MFIPVVWLWCVDSQNSGDSQFLYEARVDIRKLGHILGSQLTPIKAICSKPLSDGPIGPSTFVCTDIVQNRGLQVFQLHDDVSMQYYLPAMAK